MSNTELTRNFLGDTIRDTTMHGFKSRQKLNNEKTCARQNDRIKGGHMRTLYGVLLILELMMLVLLCPLAVFSQNRVYNFSEAIRKQAELKHERQKSELGILSNNSFAGFVSPSGTNSVRNPYRPYVSSYSSTSRNNPYSTNTTLLLDQKGNDRGRLRSNPYQSNSISNPYGIFGSPFSPTSINNPYGAGNPNITDSPLNRHGKGWLVVAP